MLQICAPVLCGCELYCAYNWLLQIADFGMSRDLAHQDYYVTSGGRIPLKWTAPEVILLLIRSIMYTLYPFVWLCIYMTSYTHICTLPNMAM